MAEHDALLNWLGTRLSPTHFAHAAISAVVSFVCVCLALRWWWFASEYEPLKYQVSLGVAGVFLAYSLGRLMTGAARLKAERRALARLRGLRGQLALDEPRSLLAPDA